jgi:hypothetical protein
LENKHARKTEKAPASRVIRQNLYKLSFRSLPGTWLRDKEFVRSHHLSGQMDSGYEANSIAFRNHTIRGMEVNSRLPLCFGGKRR